MGVIGVLSNQNLAFYTASCSLKHCTLSTLQNVVEPTLHRPQAILYSLQKLSSLFTEEIVDKVKPSGGLLWGSSGCSLSRSMRSMQSAAV